MKKLQLLLLLCITTAFSAQAQSVKEKLDKLHKDPHRLEKEAKADVYILRPKIGADSLPVHQTTDIKIKKSKKSKYTTHNKKRFPFKGTFFI